MGKKEGPVSSLAVTTQFCLSSGNESRRVVILTQYNVFLCSP